jgi:antitoxin component YwqK of YwqJK toxin-antitoxin module
MCATLKYFVDDEAIYVLLTLIYFELNLKYFNKDDKNMKKTLLLATILLLSSQTTFSQTAQVGQSKDYFTETKLPDTLLIQYLSKADGQATDFYAKSFVKELSQDSTLGYQLIYSQANGKTRFLVKTYGQNRFNMLAIVQRFYADAYYVDNRGWKINY